MSRRNVTTEIPTTNGPRIVQIEAVGQDDDFLAAEPHPSVGREVESLAKALIYLSDKLDALESALKPALPQIEPEDDSLAAPPDGGGDSLLVAEVRRRIRFVESLGRRIDWLTREVQL